MSLLSSLVTKATKSLGGEVVVELLLGQLVEQAKNYGRPGVVRVATIPASAILKLNKHADAPKVDKARRAFAEAAADLAIAIAGVAN